MPTKTVAITIDRQERFVTPGANRGRELTAIANATSTERVLLEVKGDVDIPLAPDDIVFIRGGESFSIAAVHQVQDNPALRNAIAFTLNDAPAPIHQHPPHGKITGEQLKALAGGDEIDLWCDLDGIADVLIDDADRIILQPSDHFFTVHNEDTRYEVKVILDGEERTRRFPSRITVRQAIRRSLPPSDRPDVEKFGMVDIELGPNKLSADLTLHDAGIRDGHTLSITKNSGGGGHQ